MSDQLQDGRKQFFFWDYNGIFDLGLTKHALLVRLYLSRCSGNSRTSFPSLNTIASKCNISKKSVQRALVELEEKGLVMIHHRKNTETDAQTSNLYELKDDSIEVFGDGHTDHGVGSDRPRGMVRETTKEESFKNTQLSNSICSEITPYEQKILDVLQHVENYPYDVKKDLKLIRDLVADYPEYDVLTVVKRWSHRKLDEPLTKKERPRQQISNWMSNEKRYNPISQQQPATPQAHQYLDTSNL